MIRRTALALILTSVLVAPAATAHAKDTLKTAPDVTFTTASGKSVRLSDLKGKVVLVDFWASWCIPCRKSFPEIDALNRELEPKGLIVVAVSVDEEQKNAERFLESFAHTMMIALDPKGAAAEAFKVNAMPSTMLVDRSGQIRYRHKGYTDKTIGQLRTQVEQLLTEAD